MKKLHFFFVCLFSLSLVTLKGMESKSKKEPLSKESLIAERNKLQEAYDNNISSINFSTSTAIIALFKLVNNDLNRKKVSKKTLTKIGTNLGTINEKLKAAIDQKAKELEAMKKITAASSPLPARPPMITMPKLITYNIPENPVPEAQELTPFTSVSLSFDSEPVRNTVVEHEELSNDTNSNSTDSCLVTNSLPTSVTLLSLSDVSALSQNLDVPKVQLPKQTSSILNKNSSRSWKKIITYLSGAGICTGVGIYSYYKFSPENWYRPITLGLSCIGGTTFSLLSFKNIISKK